MSDRTVMIWSFLLDSFRMRGLIYFQFVYIGLSNNILFSKVIEKKFIDLLVLHDFYTDKNSMMSAGRDDFV